MRLLQRKEDGSLVLTRFVKEEELPLYAALSHTWIGEDDEVTFDDMMSGRSRRKSASYEKIKFCAKQAAQDGLQYFWVDTCCINKNSSQELQEAIASMFHWYSTATKCYAYLSDVSMSREDAEKAVLQRPWEAAFRGSRWFTRGWTLQELLAPRSVEFYSAEGMKLGDKLSLQQCIHEVTGIPLEALRGEPLANFTIAERLSWAQNRQTTRREDKAYSLLGLFAIFMPLIYGEGDHALTRLQEEIGRKQQDRIRLDYLLDLLPTAPSAAFNSLDNQYGPTCLPDTRVELLQEIARWAEGSSDECIFWLNGIAGTGKSTVARTVARIWYDRGHLGGSFFFSRGGGEVSNADMLFTTLASQLASQIPSAKRYICEAILEHKSIAHRSLRDPVGPTHR